MRRGGDGLSAKVKAGEYTLANVLEDAKKAVEMNLVEQANGLYPRASRAPDYAQFYQSFGGQLLDAETGKLVLDKAAMEGFYQFFVDAVEAGVVRKNHIGTDGNQWKKEVANRKAAMWHGGTWHFGRYAREGNDDFCGTIEFSLILAGNADGRANTINQPLVDLITDQEDDMIEDIAAQLVKIASELRLNAFHVIQSNHLQHRAVCQRPLGRRSDRASAALCQCAAQ